MTAHARPAGSTHPTRHPRRRHPQRTQGIALPTLLVVLTAMSLFIGLTHGVLVMDRRAAAHQVRTLQAHNLADAGLSLSLALLNVHRHMDNRCLPEPASALAFRERWWPVPATEISGGAPSGQLPPEPSASDPSPHAHPAAPALRCALIGDAWQCRCGDDPDTAWPAPPHDAHAPHATALQRFVMQPITPTGAAASGAPSAAHGGSVNAGSLLARQVSVTGCVGPGQPCDPLAADRADAVRHTQFVLARAPAFVRLPQAALNATGQVTGSGRLISHAAPQLTPHGTPPLVPSPTPRPGSMTATTSPGSAQVGGMLFVHAGGDMSPSLMTAPAIAQHPANHAVLLHDTALAQWSPSALERALVGYHAQALAELPTVDAVACTADCAQDIIVHLDQGARVLLLTPQGAQPVRIPAHAALADPAQPVLLIVRGPAELDPGLMLHGLLFAHTVHVPAHALPVMVAGALVAAGDVQIDGTLVLHHAPDLLRQVQDGTGPIAVLPGSWRSP